MTDDPRTTGETGPDAHDDTTEDRIRHLNDEILVLRRRLQEAPSRVRTLEERLLEVKGQLAQAVSSNERLSATLREAREHIAALHPIAHVHTHLGDLQAIGLGAHHRLLPGGQRPIGL